MIYLFDCIILCDYHFVLFLGIISRSVGMDVSVSWIQRISHQMGYTRKKMALVSDRRETPQVQLDSGNVSLLESGSCAPGLC